MPAIHCVPYDRCLLYVIVFKVKLNLIQQLLLERDNAYSFATKIISGKTIQQDTSQRLNLILHFKLSARVLKINSDGKETLYCAFISA